MEVQCYPIAMVPGTSALLRDFLDPASAANPVALRRWYPSEPFGFAWAHGAPELTAEHRDRLASLLREEAARFNAGAAVHNNIDHLQNGAAAVVSGQQVALFGGPLLTFLKAATAIRKAQDASARTGRPHVPVFWLASEDHDLAEVDQIAFPTKTELETLKLELHSPHPVPVGGLRVDGESEAGRTRLESTLDRASELIGWGPVADLLRDCYAAEQGTTLAKAFGKLLTAVFAEFGLIVMDACSRGFHQLGADVLRGAIEKAQELEDALVARSAELTANKYHAPVSASSRNSREWPGVTRTCA